MRRIFNVSIAILWSVALAGCVAGQSLETSYTAPREGVAAGIAAGISVGLSVTDDRAFVKNGDKPAYYLGKYRAGFGNPWDVTTANNEPLADILRRDLAEDLAALGYAVRSGPPADRQLAVSVRDWNFDGYQNGKLWYDLLVTVQAADGKAVASSELSDNLYIKGSFWMGARGGFEREMPKLYPQIIRKIVRDNAEITGALRAP